MSFELEARVETGRDGLDGDLRDLQIVTTAGGTWLYAATGRSGGISAWDLHADGRAATVADWVYYPAATGIGTGPMSLFATGGDLRLLLPGIGSGEITGYDLESDGDLAPPGSYDLPGTGIGALSAVVGGETAGGVEAIYAVEAATGALAAYGLTAQGDLQARAQSGPVAAFMLTGRVEMTLAEAGGTSFLLAADSGGQRLQAYRIAPATGALTATDRIGAAEGLGIAVPTALETVTAFGATWVILAAAGSSSLSVMRLGADGSLTPTDHLIDSRATRFGGVQALSVVEAGEHVFVIAGGADDGLSLFTLLPDGQLVHLQSLAHDTGLGLENVTAIEAVAIGGAIQVFVASGTAAGLSQFTLSLDDLGSVVRASGTGAAVLTGTDGDDLVLAASGGGSLTGGQGNDVLVSGAGGAVLTGEAGRDVFVLRPGSGTLRVTDFDPAEDRLDVSAFPMLRSPAQLSVQSTGQGARLSLGGQVIVIDSADGGTLVADDLFPGGGLGTPDRVLVLTRPEGRLLRGTAAGETLRGGDGDDTVWAAGGGDSVSAGGGNDMVGGGDGWDRVWGGAGADTLFGGDGNDRVGGGVGADRIWGGNGGDALFGNDGGDRIGGGNGWDRLWAGAGNDTIFGGDGGDRIGGVDGDDLLFGGNRNDRLWGGAGDDTINGGNGDDQGFGGPGADSASGGAGRDVLWGGDDRDTLRGGMGDDTLAGEGDRDFLWGDAGNDLLQGGAANDGLHGGDGADRLWAGSGNDLLRGEAGNDFLGGGVGHDQLYGGAGVDTLLGGDGNDRLWGEAGNDRLEGGAGDDTFVFGASHGADTVVDFTPGVDALHLVMAGAQFGTLDIQARGAGTVIDTGSGTITLWGVAPDALSEADFLFG